MKELHVVEENLTAIELDRIFADAVSLASHRSSRGRRGDARLVLEDVRFIDPFMVGLLVSFDI
jgi:hypothetical protein